jgi:hypothetical protein
MTDALATTSTAVDNPTPTAPLSTPVQPAAPRPGVIARSEYDRLPPDQQSAYAHVPREGGGQDIVPRSSLPSEQPPAATTTANPGEESPALVPDQTYKFGDLELKGQEILDLLKFKGETDLRRAAIPPDPSQYKIELPKDVALPPGMDWKFNEADPALAAARAWAHANGLSQEKFSSLLGQYASMEAAKEATFRNAMKRELDALGANATMRVTALETWLNGMVGPEIAKHMRQGMFSAKIVEGLETIATKFATQGHASFTQHGRVPQDAPGRVSEEVYATMTPAQRLDYTRGFDQRQFSPEAPRRNG